MGELSDYGFCNLGRKEGKITENPRNGCLFSVIYLILGTDKGIKERGKNGKKAQPAHGKAKILVKDPSLSFSIQGVVKYLYPRLRATFRENPFYSAIFFPFFFFVSFWQNFGYSP